MKLILLFLGVTMVLSAMIDIMWTSLWLDGGAGPVANRVTSIIWRILYKLDKGNHKLLKFAGPLILISTLVLWIMMLWGGWAMIFGSGSESLINTVNNRQVLWHDIIYYAAYVIFTLGSGEFAPASGLWQLVTSVATGSGMLFLTLGASYIISIMGAVVNKRSFASSVFGIADDSEEFVLNSWDGDDFSRLDLLFNTLSAELSKLTFQHKAYPLLHYYHSDNPHFSTAYAVPVLDEALSIMKFAVPEDIYPNPVLFKKLRSSITDYLETMQDSYITVKSEIPKYPDISKLKNAGIPLVDEEEFKEKLDRIENRRRRLVELALSDGWEI